MKNIILMLICSLTLLAHYAIATEISGNNDDDNAKQKSQPKQQTADIPPIVKLQRNANSESVVCSKYFQSSPTDCDFTELEDKIMQHYEKKPGYHITQHQIIPIDKTVTKQSIYYYGYYEIRGFLNNKVFGPTRKVYLISCKKNNDNSWETDVELWDYVSTATNNSDKDTYFF